MRKFTLSGFLMLAALQVFSQKGNSAYAPAPLVPAQRTCATMERDSILRANDPSMGTLEDFENALQQVINQIQSQRASNPALQSVPYDIPTIVHVIHNGTAVGTQLNLSQAQIYSQYDVLNEDYNGLNADTNLIPTAFVPFKGTLQMNFKKALRNPSGVTLAEPGINRINRNTMGWTAPPYTQSYIDNTIKPASQWDPTKYFNVWVTDISGGLLGWAQFPPQPTPPIGGLPAAGAANTDGVVILYSAFGRVGNVAAPYNKGRTLTHEAGHFFGLRHIWGDEAQCAADDFVNDTPQQKDKNFGCPTYPLTNGTGARCNTTDPSSMFMNYMDYTDDACMYMFTDGQASRMEAVVLSSPRRTELTTSTVATPLIALDASIFSITKPSGSSCVGTFAPVVTLYNGGSTTLTTVAINYNIDGTGGQTYNWTGSLTGGNTITVTLPSITASVGAHTFNAYTSSPNGGTDGNTANDSKSQSFTIITAPTGTALPFTENFASTTFPPTGWTLSNPDANETWSRVTTAGAFQVTPLHSAKMDNFAGNIDISGQNDILTTPSINLSTANSSLKMTFAVAYAKYDASTNDSLFVEVSTDCGATWTKVYGKGGAGLQTANPTTTAFTPTAAQWRRDTIYLPAYAGIANAQFRFRNLSQWGNNTYIDDINLASTAAAPVAAFTASSTTVCAGTQVTFTDQSTNTPTSWSWSFPGGTPSTSTSQNPVVTYATAGTYNATLVATNATGSNTLTKTSYIVVNALPTVSATPTTSTVCAGTQVTMNSSGAGAGATYSWNPGSMTGATVNVTPAATATYTVTGTNSNGCMNTATASVTVNPLPTVTSTPSSTAICAGASATLNGGGAGTGGTYSWNPGSMTTASVTVNPTSTTTYTVTGTNTNGCSKTATSVVTVNPLPTVTSTPASSVICAGSSATLNGGGAGAGGTYTWNPGSLTGASVTVNPTSTTTYTVTGTNSNGCRNTATAYVGVNPAPTVTSTPATSTICAGSSTSLTGAGAGTGATYTWNPGSLSGATITVNPTTTTTYTVTGTNSSGCTSTATAYVGVNAAPTVTSTPSTSSICLGSSASLTGSGAGAGATYSWNPGSLSGATISVSPTTTTTYTVTGTNSNGCSSTATAYVGVNPVPSVNSTNQTVCQGSPATLAATGANTYSWSPASTLSSSTGSTVIATPSSTTTYTITGTTNGCYGNTTVTVTVDQAATSSAGSDMNICAGNSANLSGSIGGSATSLTWTSSGTGTFSDASSATSSYIPSAADISAGSVTLTITSNDPTGLCGASSDNLLLTIGNSDATFSYASSTICQNGSNSSPSITTQGGTFSATPSGLMYNTSTGEVNPSSSLPGVYTITYTTGGACPGTSSNTIEIAAAPIAAATATPDSTAIGATVTFTNSSTGATAYTWDFGDGSTDNTATPSHVYGAQGTYTVTMTAMNGSCISVATMTVEVIDPNGMVTAGESSIRIYPNPTEGQLMINFGSVSAQQVRVLGSLGQEIMVIPAANQSILNIDLSGHATGLYYIHITSGNETRVLKLNVKH